MQIDLSAEDLALLCHAAAALRSDATRELLSLRSAERRRMQEEYVESVKQLEGKLWEFRRTEV